MLQVILKGCIWTRTVHKGDYRDLIGFWQSSEDQAVIFQELYFHFSIEMWAEWQQKDKKRKNWSEISLQYRVSM